MKERILNTILDEQASLIAEETLKKAEVEIITGDTVTEIIGEKTVKEVILSSGGQVACDLV
jgi:NADPH-dependent 2,4-dienoyl-CoA reductase/sulfur reductase-like enzyme